MSVYEGIMQGLTEALEHAEGKGENRAGEGKVRYCHFRLMITLSELEANADKYVEMAQLQDVLILEKGKVVAKLMAADQQTA